MTEQDQDRARLKHIYDSTFDENSPRPPVPGEETAHCMSDWSPTRHKASSPSPKPEGCHRSDSSSRPSPDNPSCMPQDASAPPACLRWARSLHQLLDDHDGVELFRRYLQGEGGQHADSLDFWFACRGLRNQHEQERIQQVVKAIYRRFFQKPALPIADDLRREVARRIKSSPCPDPPVTLFDEVQVQIEDLINNTTYPNFLKSDMYLRYIQSVQNPTISSGEISSESSSSSSCASNKELSNFTSGVGPLPTLHEDLEFMPSPSTFLSHNTPGTGCLSTGYHTPNIGGSVRLTKDMLLVTQKHRALDVRPKHEAFAGVYIYRGMGAHASYNSYNPVSRQDSELQSLSSHSDARTESDNISLNECSLDSRSLHRSSRRQAAQEVREARELAVLNKETHLHETLIPRTQRLDPRKCQPLHPQQFAAILIEKLENVKRDQDTQQLLNRKLMEGESMSSLDEKTRMREVQSRELANAIREKLQLEDDNDQDILDEHVSRVFTDLTTDLSPGVASPRPHSPTNSRCTQVGYPRPRRKDKDGFSTFSGDSGNVHDFAEGSEHRLAMVKSKSMPEYADERDRFIRGGSARRSSSKMTLTNLTDSGVSVVSGDTLPVVHGAPVKGHRVLTWLLESDRSGRGAGHTHSEMSAKHRSHRTSCATSPNASRHRKVHGGSRSSSLERTSVTGPAQPFVADPSMPPLPVPNTVIQLEEARRRLMEDDIRTRSRQRGSSKHFPDVTQSSHSTLRKSMRGPRSNLQTVAPEDVTTVVFSFCDEQFPYRTKIPGRQITLKQFKEYLPKKGNYRYFFKTECEELGNQVIQEEVSNDLDIVPLWEGKIMAEVKPVD